MEQEPSPISKKRGSIDAEIKKAVEGVDFMTYVEKLVELDRMDPGRARMERPAYDKEILIMLQARESTLNRFGEGGKLAETLRLRRLFKKLEGGQTIKNFRTRAKPEEVSRFQEFLDKLEREQKDRANSSEETK